MYAIVKTGGKQYRVERGQRLLIERLAVEEGSNVMLEPILYRSEEAVFDRAGLERVQVTAKVLAHVRGEKLRVFKFKPKRGYKRRTGHRQDLTQIEVTEIVLGTSARPAAKPDAAAPAPQRPATAKPSAPKATTKPSAEKAAAEPGEPHARGTATEEPRRAPRRRPLRNRKRRNRKLQNRQPQNRRLRNRKLRNRKPRQRKRRNRKRRKRRLRKRGPGKRRRRNRLPTTAPRRERRMAHKKGSDRAATDATPTLSDWA